MPWMDDEYLVDIRERTLTPITPELRDELGRIRSSTRRVVKAVSGEFERFVREGYRVVKRAGGGLLRNPLEGKHLGPPKASKPFGGGWCKLCLREGKQTPADWLVRRNWLRSDGSQIGVAGVYCCDEHKEQSMKDASLYHIREAFTRNPDQIDYETMQTVGFDPGQSDTAKTVVKILKAAGYKSVYEGPGKSSRSKLDNRVMRGSPRVWTDAPKDMLNVAVLLSTPPTKHNRTHESARLDYPAEYAVLFPIYESIHGQRTGNPYNQASKKEFDALKRLNSAYPKGDVFLGEVKLKAGETFADAMVAVSSLERSTGIKHDLVEFQGKYYSAPEEWINKVLYEGYGKKEQASRSIPERRSGGGGGIRGAVKAGWRELMSNPRSPLPSPRMPATYDLKVSYGTLRLIQFPRSMADDALVAVWPDGEVKIDGPPSYWGFKKAVALREDTKGVKATFYGLESHKERNPGFVRSDREELGNAFVIHHEALQSGKVDGSGSRAIEAMIRRLGLSQREADYILELAGPGADDKRITAVWKELEETDPQWSREETERIHVVRIEALGSPDWGRRGNPRGRGGRGGRSSKPMPYPWEMPVKAAYSPRFMSKEQYGELANLWHLSRVPASGTNWGRYERMLWTAKEFHKAHPEISEGAAYKDLDGLLSSGW